MSAADWSVERVITDHAVEVHVHNPLVQFDVTLTQAEAHKWADRFPPGSDFADELRDAARDADICRCRHRLAAWGDLCSVCSEANEPKPDVA